MDRNDRSSIKKRSIFIGMFITLIFLSLSIRLYYLQRYKSDELTFQALKQRGKEIDLVPKRGIIFDRNLISLTNNNITPTIVIEKETLKEDRDIYNKLKNISILSPMEFSKKLEAKDDLVMIPLKERIQIDKNQHNMFQIDIVNRYSKDNLLSHVIGYINKTDNTGEVGIEKVYDEFLKSNDKNSFIVEYDKNRSIILDGVYYANQNTEFHDPAGVQLTIDYSIQNLIEQILDKEKLNGSVIVADVETGHILGMASRPNFDQDEIENYFFSQDMALYNKAVQVGYPPGSIFKIVVLLTALEEKPDILEEEYYCNGYEEINNIKISCGSAHGWISVEDGFAKSCNSLFIQIAKRIGGPEIISMAKKLGFGEKVNIGLLEEIEGNLPEEKNLLGAAIGNIAIGQGQLEVTPLQITDLMLTIVNKGIKKPISLVKGITNRDGYIIKDVVLEEEFEIIPKKDAEYIFNMLRYVVTEGTGKTIDLEDIGGSGGKTGSAEAILNKNQVIHGWFSGFYPAENPKYVITVLIEDAEKGSRTATPIFEKISKGIYLLNNKN